MKTIKVRPDENELKVRRFLRIMHVTAQGRLQQRAEAGYRGVLAECIIDAQGVPHYVVWAAHEGELLSEAQACAALLEVAHGGGANAG